MTLGRAQPLSLVWRRDGLNLPNSDRSCHREPSETAGDGAWRGCCGRHGEEAAFAAFQLSPCRRKHNPPDQLVVPKLGSKRNSVEQ